MHLKNENNWFIALILHDWNGNERSFSLTRRIRQCSIRVETLRHRSYICWIWSCWCGLVRKRHPLHLTWIRHWAWLLLSWLRRSWWSSLKSIDIEYCFRTEFHKKCLHFLSALLRVRHLIGVFYGYQFPLITINNCVILIKLSCKQT